MAAQYGYCSASHTCEAAALSVNCRTLLRNWRVGDIQFM